MTTTHTPGPWAARSWADDEHYIPEIWTRDFGGETVGDSIRRIEDARLAAAAPDLLAALRGVVLCADARGDAEPLDAYQTRAAMLPGQIARAYAAIARATGADT